MSWKRRWGIVTALALAQGAIIVAYQGFFAGSLAPAQAPTEKTSVVTPKKEEAAKPSVTQTAEPKVTSQPPVAPGEVPAPPPFVVPAEFNKSTPPPPQAETVAPPPLPDLGPTGAVPLPAVKELPPPTAIKPVGPLPTAIGKAEDKVVPVGGVVVNPPSARGLPSDNVPVKVTEVPDTNAAKIPPPGKAPEFTQVYSQTPEVVQAASPTPPAQAPSISPTNPKIPDAPMPPVPVTPPYKTPVDSAPAPKPLTSLPPPSSTVVDPLVKNTGTPIKAEGTQKVEQPAVEAPCPWTLRVEIIKGRTLLTAQTGQEVQFRVTCDKLDLQSPRGNIKASGNVKVESEGLQGACELLSIAWQADQVVLEGNAQLKCQREGQDMDLKAAKLSLRLSIATHPSQPRVSSNRVGEVRGATFLSRSKSVRGEYRNSRPIRSGSSSVNTPLRPVPTDGGYDRYLGNEPPHRGSKSDE